MFTKESEQHVSWISATEKEKINIFFRRYISSKRDSRGVSDWVEVAFPGPE
jgi:hypothetical protein